MELRNQPFRVCSEQLFTRGILGSYYYLWQFPEIERTNMAGARQLFSRLCPRPRLPGPTSTAAFRSIRLTARSPSVVDVGINARLPTG